MRRCALAAGAVAGLLLAAGCGPGEADFRATVRPAVEPPRRECVGILLRQTPTRSRQRAREECSIGHGKVWLHARVRNVGEKRSRPICRIEAFAADGRRRFVGGLPLSLVRYPLGPYIGPGREVRFTLFIEDEPHQPVDRYSATCDSVPEDAV